jgi:acyl-coenzyme A thioesterase PaaI-like protein
MRWRRPGSVQPKGSADIRSRPYLAALADQVLAFATMTIVPDDRLFRTVNLQMNFLKIGRRHPLAIEDRVAAQTRQLVTSALNLP